MQYELQNKKIDIFNELMETGKLNMEFRLKMKIKIYHQYLIQYHIMQLIGLIHELIIYH